MGHLHCCILQQIASRATTIPNAMPLLQVRDVPDHIYRLLAEGASREDAVFLTRDSALRKEAERQGIRTA
jgi:hypothetical protein